MEMMQWIQEDFWLFMHDKENKSKVNKKMKKIKTDRDEVSYRMNNIVGQPNQKQ